MPPGRVLIVDDEPAMRVTLAANLELEGWVVLEAASAAEALRLIEREEVDVVLSDVRMPGENGVELFRRAATQRPDLPFVLMTGFAAEDHLDAAVTSGVFAVLTKPFGIDQVVAALQRAARRPIVLVTDPRAHDARAIVLALRGYGIRAECTSDVDASTQLLRSGQVDICLLELSWKDASSEQVIGKLRAADPSVALIVYADRDPSQQIPAGASEAIVASVRKPLDLKAVARVIARARSAPPPRARAGIR